MSLASIQAEISQLDSQERAMLIDLLWQRIPAKEFPSWATKFIDEVKRDGLPGRMLKRLKRTG